MIHCHVCAPPREFPGTTLAEFHAHYDTAHGHLANLPVVPDLNDWRTRAIEAVKTLAKTGREFRFYDVVQIAGDPPNHRTVNGTFSSQIEHMGLAHVVRYEKSDRPGTKASACAVWRGGPKPPREAAA